MTPGEALVAIRRIWTRWAVHELDDGAAWGEVAVVLEQAGYPPIGEVSWPSDDGHGGGRRGSLRDVGAPS